MRRRLANPRVSPLQNIGQTQHNIFSGLENHVSELNVWFHEQQCDLRERKKDLGRGLACLVNVVRLAYLAKIGDSPHLPLRHSNQGNEHGDGDPARSSKQSVAGLTN